MVRALRWHRRGHWFNSSIDHIIILLKKEIKIAKKNEKLRVNNSIAVSEVRLIDENGKQCGVVNIAKALDMALNADLDLVEIVPNSSPPVCKILNFGKYRYDRERQKKINKKKQHIVNVKEIRLRPNTDKHDLEIKLNKAQKFLLKGDKLKVTIMFRGREFLRQEIGYNLLNDVKNALSDISVVDKEPNLQGRRISLILSPK